MHRLLPGSELLRAARWRQATQNELKGLIKRFATREEHSRRKGLPTFLWRNRRLNAVAVYEARFELVPNVFRARRLEPQKSYYVRDGKYVWPERGAPGDPVFADPVSRTNAPPNKSLERTREG
jgi:hypothetical protein